MLSAVIAWWTGLHRHLAIQLFSHKPLFFALFVIQLAAVIVLSTWVMRLSVSWAVAIYLRYAALTGVTLSVVFMRYTLDAVVSAFVLTAVAFAGLSSGGVLTKKDLNPIGSFCISRF